MSDARIILQTQGQQDEKILQNAEFTHFKKDYRTYSLFGTDWLMVNYNEKNSEESAPRDNQRITMRIPLNGDMLNEVYLRFKLVTDDRWLYGTGSDLSDNMFSPMTVFELFEKVELLYNDTILSELTSDFILCYFDLYKSAPQKMAVAQMISYDNLSKNNVNLSILEDYTYLYTPLPFWFHKSPIHAIPLWALKDSNLSLRITMKNYSGPNMDRFIHDIDMMIQYGYLTEEEKEQCKTLPMEYVMKQVVSVDKFEMTPNRKYRVEIPATHFIEYFLWNVAIEEDGLSSGRGFRNFSDAIRETTIIMNGNTVMEANGDYYNWVQRYEHFYCDSTLQLYDPNMTASSIYVPSRNANVQPPMPIYTYSFALEPRIPKESGFVSTVKFNNTVIELTSNNIDDAPSAEYHPICNVYMVRYNIMRIKDGYISMLYN
jgi:hypothetical protein